MAYERIAQTDLAELQRLAATLTETDPPSRYERIGQTNIAELQRLTTDTADTVTSIGGYERIGSIDVAVLQRKVLAAAASTAHSRSLTVNHAKVPSTQTNFPVLVSITDATLKTVANGGHVRRSDGFDIGFYSDSGLTTKLKWDMDTYDGVAGTVVAHVKIASLSSSSDSVFYMGYGSDSITTDQSDPVNVWSNSYLGVYHLGNGTTLSVADSLAANNGTNHGATATTGQIGGGASFVAASTQYIDLGTGLNPAAITFSGWLKGTTFPNAFNTILARDNGSVYSGMWVISASKINSAFFASSFSGVTGTTTLSTGTWYYAVATYNSTFGDTTYLNGVSEGNSSAAGTLNTTAVSMRIGNNPSSVGQEWNGQIDEVRIASVARSADWITTEYNNQRAPGTFITVGIET